MAGPLELAIVDPSTDPTEHVRELKAEVEDYYIDAQQALQARLPKILENQAFYRGFHWGTPTDRSIIGGIPDLDERERPEVLNYTRATVRSAAASKIRGGVPNPEAVSANKDLRSRIRARLSQRLVRSFMRNGTFRYETLIRSVMGSEIDGLAWLKVYWNPFKGKRRPFPVANDQTGELSTHEDGEPIMAPQLEGDIEVQYVDCLDGLPDPHARDQSEIRHFFHRKLLAISRLEDMFPVDFFGEPTKGRWTASGGDKASNAARQSDAIQNDGGSVRSLGGAHAAGGNELAELVEYWEQPTQHYPEGRLLVWCGDIVVSYSETLPYLFPFVPVFGQNIVPGSLWADGTVSDIKSINKSMNYVSAILREWTEFASAPTVFNPKNSGVPSSHFENLAGGIIEYNPGGKPEWQAPPPPPQALFEHQDRLENQLKNVSTYSDITRGQNQPGDLSGRAMAYLKEFEGGVHQPDEILLKQSITDVLVRCLYLARDFYDEGRLVLVVGDAGKPSMEVFKREDYDFDVALVIDPFSGRPNSPALRFSEVMDLGSAGLLGDEPQAVRARKLLEMDDADASSVDTEEVHRERAMQEQLGFLEDPMGFELEVLPADNDQVHLEEHDVFRVSPEYLAMPFEIRGRFEQHAEFHEQQHQMKLGGYSQQTGMLQGGGPPPGAPPEADPGVPSPPDGGHGASVGSAESAAPAGPNVPPPPPPGAQSQ